MERRKFVFTKHEMDIYMFQKIISPSTNEKLYYAVNLPKKGVK